MDVSPVIAAVGVPVKDQSSVIRLSFGYPTSKAELESVFNLLKAM